MPETPGRTVEPILDVVVVPGDQCDGMVCAIEWKHAVSPLSYLPPAHSALMKSQTLSCMAPVLDIDLGDAFEENQDQIFAACGRFEVWLQLPCALH
jgi:hypothetical protein